MSRVKNNGKWLAIWIGILQIFIGIGAVPAGIAMITDPSGSTLGMHVEMLINSPFSNFFSQEFFCSWSTGLGACSEGWHPYCGIHMQAKLLLGWERS